MRMSLFTTFYFEFGCEYEYYLIRIQNGYFEFGFTFEYLLDLQHRVIMSINFRGVDLGSMSFPRGVDLTAEFCLPCSLLRCFA
jgi:hypothetical protein